MHESYGLRTESNAIVSPLLRPSPPPGLLPPPGLELPEEVEPLANKASAGLPVHVPAAETEQYKVLLDNLPEPMLKECMLRAMLEQANLNDVVHMAFRSNGKALITFSTYASVGQCINHFHARQWGGTPIRATYVRIAKKQVTTTTVHDEPMQEVKAKPMSAHAPVFVPTAFKAGGQTLFSADAPAFVPASEKISDHDRFSSYASTDVGPSSENASDGCDSEMEVQVACT